MGKFITGVVGVIGALWLLFAGMALVYWWDRRDAGTPAINYHWLFLNWTWKAPDSLLAKALRDAHDLGICHASEEGLESSIRAQNDAIQALRDKSRNVVQGTLHARAQASAQRDRVQRRVDAIAGAQAHSCADAENLIREIVK